MRHQADWRPVLAVMALSPQQKRATADARAALGAWFLLHPQCMEPAACVAILATLASAAAFSLPRSCSSMAFGPVLCCLGACPPGSTT